MTPTVERLAVTYAFLREFEPFCSWRLPHTSEVRFAVNSAPDLFGLYLREGRGKKPPLHSIAVSRRNVGHFHTLCRVMAHEMIHLYQGVRKTFSRSQHNEEFHRLAQEVCVTFGWDPKEFV